MTLIHSSEELVIKGATNAFQSSVQKKLKDKRINLVLGIFGTYFYGVFIFTNLIDSRVVRSQGYIALYAS